MFLIHHHPLSLCFRIYSMIILLTEDNLLSDRHGIQYCICYNLYCIVYAVNCFILSKYKNAIFRRTFWWLVRTKGTRSNRLALIHKLYQFLLLDLSLHFDSSRHVKSTIYTAVTSMWYTLWVINYDSLVEIVLEKSIA